ncbi:MAG: pantoate--beta-alanine ligase, partial [Nocardioidaceae bacterium]
ARATPRRRHHGSAERRAGRCVGVRVVSTRADLRAALQAPAAANATGGQPDTAAPVLVPTMGALHKGHEALLDTARAYAGPLVVSIFVNPLQFGPGEDLDRYPRTLEADLAMCESHGADLAFAPPVDVVYPGGEPQVSIDPGPLAGTLEGVSRPGHFHGVLTVVAKMFGLVRPGVAMFGQKDYQQLVLVRQLVRDLCMDVDIVGAQTARDDDGLALSSRNGYLSDAERVTAGALSRALRAGAAAATAGGGADDVLVAAHAELDAEAELKVDYLELRDPELGPAPTYGEARLLVAGRVGTTHLIDNIAVTLGPPRRPGGGEGA